MARTHAMRLDQLEEDVETIKNTLPQMQALQVSFEEKLTSMIEAMGEQGRLFTEQSKGHKELTTAVQILGEEIRTSSRRS